MRIRIHFLVAFFLWAFTMTTATAQNGQFDVRFTVKSFTCDSSKVTIAVQVRSHDMAHTFLMGDANYRFEYDPRLINTPKIVSQEHFSNIAPASDFNYGPQNLNGSSAGATKGIVSLNTFYTGVASSARRVDTAWTTVSCISFNVVDGTDCFPLTWHDDITFPVTGMNEVELLPSGEYNLYVVAPGGVFQNLQACYQATCNNQGTPPTVTVTPIVTKQDSAVTVCMPISDPDANSVFTATVCGIAQHGIVNPSVIGSQLCVQYTPVAGFTGSDSVCITICDNTNKCTNTTVPITVNVRPSPPTVATTSIVTKQDSTVTVCTTITDPDVGSTFTASLCNAPAHGTATPSVNGNQLCITYTPAPNYAGSDEVCVRVCDNTGLCTNVTVPVTVNQRPHPPTVTIVPIVTKEDSALTVCMPISDPDPNSSFSATVCGLAQHGIATPTAVGNQLCVAYTPVAGFTGQDSVCVRICDNSQICVNITIPITVNPKPHTPTVTPVSITTKQDSTVTVCTSIADPDANSAFTASVCNSPLGGSAQVLVNGNQLCIRFVPNGSFIGQTSICVNVCDNTGVCTQTTVPVTIERRPTPPTVSPTSIVTKQDSTVTVCTTISDADPNSSFTATLCSQPNGSATPSVNGNQLCITYTPRTGFFGNDQICVHVCDNTGLCVDITVPVTVNQFQTPPTVFVTPISTKTDTTITVCYNISDAQGGPFTAALCNVPAGMTATPSVNGNQVCVTIRTGSNPNTTSLCLRVCDPTGLCTEVTVPVTISVTPTAPFIIEKIPILTKQDSVATVCMEIGDNTPNPPYVVTICGQGAHGTATVGLDGNLLCVTYVPSIGYTGTDAVCVRICEIATGLCTQESIPVLVSPKPHTPVVTATPIITRQDTVVRTCFPITDPDANSTFSASLCSTPTHGTASVSVVGSQVCLTYTSATGFFGLDSVCIRVCDNTGLCTQVKVPITVTEKTTAQTLVSIRKRLSPTQSTEVRLGNSVNYKITVKNNSTFPLSNVLVRDSIPQGMVLNQSNLQGWSTNAFNTVAFRTIPSIASGDSVTLDISLVLLYGNPRSSILNRAFVFDAQDQTGFDIIANGQEPRDSASFMIKPFDPMGVVYCENTGFILKGGHIELVSAPSGGSIFFATDASGTVLDGTNGTYQFFTNGVPGRYEVRYVHPNGYPLSTRCIVQPNPLDPTGNDGDTNDNNGDGVIDKDGTVNDYVTIGSNVVNGDHLQNFSCANNPYWLRFDLATDDPFVFNNNIPVACAVIIGSTVGVDLNENGVLDGNESPLGGVTVELYLESNLNTPVATTTTDANGRYVFDGLAQGIYRVKFTKPTGYRFTSQNINNNNSDNNDSDADPATGWTQIITLNWGDAETTVGAHFVPTNINPPTITGTHIITKEDSVLNICLPIVDNTPSENFTPSVCGVQNGTITNLTIINRQVCFTYTPQFGYRGDDTLCIRVCDRDGQCDTARITLDIRAKNNRFDCAQDGIAPVITLTNPLLNGVRHNDTVTYSCVNPPIFGVRDARATDNNDPNPRLSFRDVGIKRGNCQTDGYKVLMECDWIATDSCGNTSTFKIFVKITDNVNPVLGSIPANITVNLNNGETIPTPPSVSATDNCGNATVTLKRDSVPTGVECNYTMIRTWTATDECGNTSTGVQRITVIKTCPCSISAKPIFTNATCGASNGTATVLVDNASNYTFTWSANSGTGSGNTRSGLAVGNYSVTVSRNGTANCDTIVSFSIANDTTNCCTPPTATVTKTDATCGNANGTATINVDVAANYLYTWSSGGSSNVSRSGLAAGNYSVTVSRINQPSCQTVVSFIINNDVSNCCTTPAATITVSDATCGGSNGTASVSVDTISHYTYTWSPNLGTVGAFPNVRTNLPVGNYSVTISRVNLPSCQRVINFTIGNNTNNCCTDFIPDISRVTAVNGCNTIADVCIGMSNTSIVSVTDNGAAYTSGFVTCSGGLSVKLAVGTHNLVFRTTTGCLDSIEIKVVCVNPVPQSIDNIMVLGEKDSIQLQTNELYGSRFTLRKIRGTTSGSVDYTNILGTMVIARTAKQIGVEYATYVITDEYGISDTTYIKTEVILRTAARRPLAIDDKIEIPKGKSVFIDVMQNDSVRGILKGVTIISKPKHGSTNVLTDNRIVYSPLSGYCGKDELTYTICNGYGCDTAVVSISVLCDGVKIYSGFSPNSDNVNDNFIIEGIENYPNNVLNIYNRWGNQVMSVKGYQNDWQGTWNGTPLPDGTYFYIFDDGNGKIYKGYVQIQR